MKLAGDHKDSQDKIYCGRESAYIEQLDGNDKWVKGVNASVVNKTEGITSPGGVKASKGKGSGDVEKSEEDIVAHVESSEGIESFGGYGASGGAEYLGSVRGSGGAVGSESVERPESAERSGNGSFGLDSSRLELSTTNQSQDGRSTALHPMVSQPGRPLPNVPKK